MPPDNSVAVSQALDRAHQHDEMHAKLLYEPHVRTNVHRITIILWNGLVTFPSDVACIRMYGNDPRDYAAD